MNFETLQTPWATYEQNLALNLKLNLELLRATRFQQANSAIRPIMLAAAAELALGILSAILLVMFAANHLTTLPFLLPAVALYMFVIFQVAFAVYHLLIIRAVDFGAPVVALQKKLVQLRIHRIRVTQATIMLSPLLWIPLLIVLFKAVDVNANTAFDNTWLLANVLFGLTVIPVTLWMAHRFAGSFQRLPFIQQLLDDIAGRELNTAIDFLAKLSSFEQEAERT